MDKNNSLPLTLVAILALSFIVYSQCLSFSFVNWDDNGFLGSALIQKPPFSNLNEIFLTHNTGRYYPLTFLVQQIQYFFFDFEPFYYHFTNLIFHFINIVLVFKIFGNLRVDKKVAGLIAFLFALHPLQVEAVAWVSSLKDLLYSFFFLWIIYIYTKQPQRQRYRYHLILIYFLALSAKINALSLPFLLILFDYCEKRKIHLSDWITKIPLFILAFVFVAIGLAAARSVRAFPLSAILPWIDRFWLSGYAACMYIVKIIFPFSLCNYYPLPAKIHGFFPPEIYIMSLLFFFSSVLMLKKLPHQPRVAFVAFLIMIFPCLHLTVINNCIIYERFVYLASLGIFFIMSFFACSILEKFPSKKARYLMRIFLIVYFCFLTISCFRRCPVWENSATLWTDVIKKRPDSPAGYFFRSSYYLEEKNWEAALRDINVALDLNPRYVPSYRNRAEIYLQTGRLHAALNDYKKILALDPGNKEAQRISKLITQRMKKAGHASPRRP